LRRSRTSIQVIPYEFSPRCAEVHGYISVFLRVRGVGRLQMQQNGTSPGSLISHLPRRIQLDMEKRPLGSSLNIWRENLLSYRMWTGSSLCQLAHVRWFFLIILQTSCRVPVAFFPSCCYHELIIFTYPKCLKIPRPMHP
jgi:hypothetical protein